MKSKNDLYKALISDFDSFLKALISVESKSEREDLFEKALASIDKTQTLLQAPSSKYDETIFNDLSVLKDILTYYSENIEDMPIYSDEQQDMLLVLIRHHNELKFDSDSLERTIHILSIFKALSKIQNTDVAEDELDRMLQLINQFSTELGLNSEFVEEYITFEKHLKKSCPDDRLVKEKLAEVDWHSDVIYFRQLNALSKLIEHYKKREISFDKLKNRVKLQTDILEISFVKIFSQLPKKLPKVSIENISENNRKLREISSQGMVIQEKIGSGTFGSIYRVTMADKNQYALKVGDPYQMYSEAKKAVKVPPHQHVITTHGLIITNDGQVGILMPLGERDLFAEIHNSIRLPISDRLNYSWQVAAGIAWLHENNMIHQDIKIQNFILTSDINSKYPIIKAADLGSIVDSRTAHLRPKTGTYEYVPPENLPAFTRKEIEQRSLPLKGHPSLETDSYSLGATIHEIMTGELRHKDKDLGKTLSYPKYFPKALRSYLKKMTHQEPSKRPSTPETESFLLKWLNAGKELSDQVNIPNKAGDTPLICAIRENRFDMIQFLLERGADINKLSQGVSPITCAIQQGQSDIVVLLLQKGANITSENLESLKILSKENKILTKLLDDRQKAEHDSFDDNPKNILR